jgi:hypothetical protein
MASLGWTSTRDQGKNVFNSRVFFFFNPRELAQELLEE